MHGKHTFFWPSVLLSGTRNLSKKPCCPRTSSPQSLCRTSCSTSSMPFSVSKSQSHGSSWNTGSFSAMNLRQDCTSRKAVPLLGCLHCHCRFGQCFASFGMGGSNICSLKRGQSHPRSKARTSSSVAWTAARLCRRSGMSSEISI